MHFRFDPQLMYTLQLVLITKTRYILNSEAFMALYFSQSIPSRYTNYITETMVKERKTVKE